MLIFWDYNHNCKGFVVQQKKWKLHFKKVRLLQSLRHDWCKLGVNPSKLFPKLLCNVIHPLWCTCDKIMFSFCFFIFHFYRQEPTYHKVGSKPRPAPRGFLSKVGPTCSNSHWITRCWFFSPFFYLSQVWCWEFSNPCIIRLIPFLWWEGEG